MVALPPDRLPSDRSPGAVIADYLQALEHGENPNRQALLEAHPRLAAELATYFDNLDRLDRIVAPLAHHDIQSVDSRQYTPRPTAPRPFGDYVLEAEIACGGMGVVYRARQISLNRTVALKMILTGQLASAPDIARFRAEAEAAANLVHPNILPVFEVGEHDGQQYFSMKLAEGGSLAGRVAELVTHPRQAAALMARLARTVNFAHQRSILHRDLKPVNVLFDADDTPYLTDFGLAKRLQGDSDLTQSGRLVGTPSYMSPEQARADKPLTTATDVYSLGVILYELLTGRPPFRTTSPIDTIRRVLETEPDSPRVLSPLIDRDLAAITLRCLQKLPQARYESAAALADDLERWLSGEPTRARPPSLVRQVRHYLRLRRAYVVGVLLALTTVLLCARAINGGAHFKHAALGVLGYFLGWVSGLLSQVLYPKW